MKRTILTTITLLTGLFNGIGVNAAENRSDTETAEGEPNVLWIVLEDANPWFSCYGETLIETPNIDQLAAERHPLRSLLRLGRGLLGDAFRPRCSERCRRASGCIITAARATSPRAPRMTASA